MAMNLKELIAQARFKSKVSNTTRVTDAQITKELNIAQDKIAARLVKINEDFFEEQKTTFSLVANSGLYQLPTNLLKFKQLRLAYTAPTSDSDYAIAVGYNPTDINVVGPQEESVSMSNPIVDITSNYMRISPKPSASVSAGGQIYYIARPDAIALSADISTIPGDYHDLMAIYAAARICEADETWDKADRLDNKFLQGLQYMENECAGRELNYPLRFKDPKEAGLPRATREL